MTLEALSPGALLEFWKDFIRGPAHLSMVIGAPSRPLNLTMSDDTEIDLKSKILHFSSCSFPVELIRRFLTLPEFKNLKRKGNWLQSRICVSEVLEQARSLGIPPERTALSISHTEGASVAVMCELGLVRAIGVDLESTDRVISQGVTRKIMNEVEKKLFLLPIQAWVIKEASFKANPKNTHTQISQYQITSAKMHPHFIEGKVDCLDHSFEYRLVIIKGNDDARYFLAVAQFCA